MARQLGIFHGKLFTFNSENRLLKTSFVPDTVLGTTGTGI